jgi:hypothetical protein
MTWRWDVEHNSCVAFAFGRLQTGLPPSFLTTTPDGLGSPVCTYVCTSGVNVPGGFGGDGGVGEGLGGLMGGDGGLVGGGAFRGVRGVSCCSPVHKCTSLIEYVSNCDQAWN